MKDSKFHLFIIPCDEITMKEMGELVVNIRAEGFDVKYEEIIDERSNWVYELEVESYGKMERRDVITNTKMCNYVEL